MMRLDWKYALRQELTWTGFHYSDLCNFRKRLLHMSGNGWCSNAWWPICGSGAISKNEAATNRFHQAHRVGGSSESLGVVWEAIRVALRALEDADASWVRNTAREFC